MAAFPIHTTRCSEQREVVTILLEWYSDCPSLRANRGVLGASSNLIVETARVKGSILLPIINWGLYHDRPFYPSRLFLSIEYDTMCLASQSLGALPIWPTLFNHMNPIGEDFCIGRAIFDEPLFAAHRSMIFCTISAYIRHNRNVLWYSRLVLLKAFASVSVCCSASAINSLKRHWTPMCGL